MGVAEMGQLPIEHAGQCAILDQQIADAEIAMVEHGGRWRGGVVFQPAQAQRDDRTVAARRSKPNAEVRDTFAQVECRHCIG